MLMAPALFSILQFTVIARFSVEGSRLHLLEFVEDASGLALLPGDVAAAVAVVDLKNNRNFVPHSV